MSYLMYPTVLSTVQSEFPYSNKNDQNSPKTPTFTQPGTLFSQIDLIHFGLTFIGHVREFVSFPLNMNAQANSIK